MKKKQFIFLHVFYWTLYFLGSVIIPEFIFHEDYPLLSATFFVVTFVCFYVNYFYVIPKFFDIHKLYKVIIAFFASVSVFALVRYSIEEILLPMTVGYGNFSGDVSLIYYFYNSIYFGSTTIFVSSVFSLFKMFFTAESERLQLESEKKSAQLQALKSQINPHFIFNSLNNIYSLVYQKSEKALIALEELSQLLRYSTKDLEKDYISLDKEIGYIDSLIALEKLRIKDPELLIIEKDINHPNLDISPMLLVPFVENAFKHGDFEGKGFILKMNENDKIIHFYLHNFKSGKVKDAVSGIGIDNVKKRLEILYSKKHQLKITDSETEFTVNLTINLQ